MLAGFGRFFYEGMECWTEIQFHGLINPRGRKHETSDPEIVIAIQELQDEGYIRFIGKDPCFIEVLKVGDDEPWVRREP